MPAEIFEAIANIAFCRENYPAPCWLLSGTDFDLADLMP
jgi:hypothetical protein